MKRQRRKWHRSKIKLMDRGTYRRNDDWALKEIRARVEEARRIFYACFDK